MLELIYEKKDDIPEAFRDLYTEKDGKWHLTGVNGMKTQADVDTVKEALRKEREDHGETKKKLKPWGDLDPDETLATLDRVKELEAAAGDKLDEEKLNEMVEARLAQKTGPLEREINKLKEENATLTGERDQLQGDMKRRDMNEAVRSAAVEAKVHQSAIPDIEIVAANMLEFDEDGKLITKDGLNGMTPGIDVKGFFQEMQKSRPHWWPESVGGGARGGGGPGGFSGPNPWSHDKWNMTEQGKIVREQGREVADRMAQQAGTTVGGTRPAAPSQK